MSEDELKGLDEYAKRFLMPKPTAVDDIKISKGNAVDPKKLEAFLEQQKTDFLNRAGKFTEDLIGFIVEQKDMRSLDDRTVVFALALANINLRHSFCAPQNSEEAKTHNSARKKELAEEWDAICWSAQSYFNENT